MEGREGGWGIRAKTLSFFDEYWGEEGWEPQSGGMREVKEVDVRTKV